MDKFFYGAKYATEASNTRLVDRLKVDGAAGVKFLSQPNNTVCFIMCSVKQGAVDIYFGTNPVLTATPDFHFGQTNRPEWTVFPPGEYTFTCVAAGVQDTHASVIFGGP